MFFKEVAKTRPSRTLLELGQDLLDAIFFPRRFWVVERAKRSSYAKVVACQSNQLKTGRKLGFRSAKQTIRWRKTNGNWNDSETRETKQKGKRPATTTCKPMQSKAMANSRPSIFGFFCIGRKTVNLRGWICGCSPSKRWKSDTKMIRGGPIFSMSRG